MPQNTRRRNALIALIVVIIVILLLLTRCLRERPETAARDGGTMEPTPSAAITNGAPVDQPGAVEALTPATLTAPGHVPAGAVLSVSWTGPDNPNDYVTIVRREAPGDAIGNYRQTKDGLSLELTAPIEPGPRGVGSTAGNPRPSLGGAPVGAEPVAAAFDAAPEIAFGAPFSFGWTGRRNKGDYITIVPKGTPDEVNGEYADTANGSP